jgi:DNA-binding NarL/FixJ family response regulator
MEYTAMVTTRQPPITLLLTDDDPITRAGIRALLSQAADILIVGEARNGQEAQKMLKKLQPKILLLDLKMPGLSPAELEKWVRKNHPDTVTLVLTAHDRDAYLASMMDAGAAGYMSKDASAEGLVAAIRRAAHGEILFDLEQFTRARQWREAVSDRWNNLTDREREVLKLMADGLDNKEIAEALFISVKTTAFHVTNILDKIGVDSRQKAIAWVHAHDSGDLETLLG